MKIIWSGTISLGLIDIPVNLYSGTKRRGGISFDLLEKSTNSRIKQVRISQETGKKVSSKEIVKGYEYESGDYVILEDSDFEKANPEKRRTIDLVDFVDAREIPTEYYKKFYYLEPQENHDKTYTLLRDALKESEKVGIAKFVIRNKENLAALKPKKDLITLNELRFANELRSIKPIRLPSKADYTESELTETKKLIKALTSSFNLEKYQDTYTQDIREMILQKLHGKLQSEAPKKTSTREKKQDESIINKIRKSLSLANVKEKG